MRKMYGHMKRVLAAVTAAAMMITSVPQANLSVYAAENDILAAETEENAAAEETESESDETPGEGGKDETPGEGGKDETPGEGGKDETPGEGGKDETPGEGGKDETLGEGGKDETPGEGGKDETPGEGEDGETPEESEEGEEEEPTEEEESEEPEEEGEEKAADEAEDDGFVIENGVLKEYTGSAKDVVIPSTVTSIKASAFSKNTTIESVTIPSSVQSIGGSAFYNASNLKSVTWNEGLKSLGGDVFKNCSSLTSIKMQGDNDASAKTAYIPSTLESVSQNGEFEDCTGLETLVFQSGMEKIPAYMAKGGNCIKYLEIPNTVKEIGQSAFADCTALDNVTLPSSVQSIGGSAFYNASNLKSVTWNEGLKSLGGDVFKHCSSLTSIKMQGDEDASANTAYIPSTLESVSQNGEFEDCTGLETLVFQSGMEKIPAYMAKGGNCIKYLEIPNTVKEIGQSAFADCTALDNVTLPSSVQSIGGSAFYNASNLKSVIWNEGLKSLGGSVFDKCSSLTSIKMQGDEDASANTAYIPSTLESVSQNGEFEDCTGLETLVFQSGMEKIPAYMAKGGNCIKYLEIPDTVEEIGASAFSGCTSLESAPLPERLEKIGGSAFYNCSSLPQIEFPFSLKEIENSAFERCSRLTELVFYHALEKIDYEAFSRCTSLSKVHFNSTKTQIRANAFSNTSSALEVYCYPYSTAKALAEEKGYTVKLVSAMNIEEDGFSVTNTEDGIRYGYNAVRKKGSGRNVAVVDADGKVIAKGAWRAADSVWIGTEEITAFEFNEESGALQAALGRDGSEADVDLSGYEMVKTVPYAQYESIYKNLEGMTTDEFEAKKIGLSYQDRDGSMLGMSLASVLNYWDLLTEAALTTGAYNGAEKKELNAVSYDEYKSEQKEFALNGSSALAGTVARLQLWQDTSEYDAFLESIKDQPITVAQLQDYVGITNQEVKDIETVWISFDEEKEISSHVVLLDTSRNIELVTPKEKEALSLNEEEDWYKVYVIDADYPVYDDASYYSNGRLISWKPTLSDAYGKQNCLYIKEGTNDWIFKGKTNAGQKDVAYSSAASNQLSAYALSAGSFSERIVSFANGNAVTAGSGTSLGENESEIYFHAADVTVKNASDATVFAMVSGQVTTNTLSYVKMDVDEKNPDGRKNVTIRVPQGAYTISVSQGLWLLSDRNGYCGTSSDGAVTAAVTDSKTYTAQVGEGKEVTYYLGDAGTSAADDGFYMEYSCISAAEDEAALTLQKQEESEILSVTMNPQTKGTLDVVKSQEPTQIHERRNAYLAQADGIDILEFVYHRSVAFDSCGGEEIPMQNVHIGEHCEEPELAEREGYTLCGWSKDDTFTEDWDFAVDTVQEDMVLYARWRDNIRDDEESDTEICIDIVNPDSYVYDGKKIIPKLIVWDRNKVLTEGVDYKVAFKNNVNACDITDASVQDKKKPQVIVQGIGNYESKHKFVEYFSIQPADMSKLEITMPDYVAAKAKNKSQKISAVVKTAKITVPAKNYTINYYRDKELSDQVNGLTSPGIYYVAAEAKKDGVGDYVGNYTGRSKAKKVEVIAPELLLNKAKVKTAAKLKVSPQIQDAEKALQALSLQLTIGKKTYKTAGNSLDTWQRNFTVTAIDYDGTEISAAELYKVVNTAGTKTLVIRPAKDSTENYEGEAFVKVTIAGTQLAKRQFVVSYAAQGQKAVTSTEFTAESMLPNIYTELEEGKDYEISYKLGKKAVEAEEVVNAGSYSAVITGIGGYSGSLSYKFSIDKVNLPKAYTDGKITIAPKEESAAEYQPKGAQKEFVICYDADGSGDTYEAIELDDSDRKLSFQSNKKVTGSGKTAYAVVSGLGNFKGSLKGDGKAGSQNTKSGIATELNFEIGAKNMDSEDIRILVQSLTRKNGKLTGAKIVVYNQEVKVASSDYTLNVSEENGNAVLRVTGKGLNYTGTKTVSVKTDVDLIKTNDSKKVKITFAETKKYFWNGEAHYPEMKITDEKGNLITDKFDIIYGENIKRGTGTVTVIGKLEEGYCEQKVVKFVIYPKWMQWIFD